MYRIFSISAIFCFLAAVPYASTQTVDVTGHVRLLPTAPLKNTHKKLNPPNIVVWLEPLHPEPTIRPQTAVTKTYAMVQKDKQFHPHLLVVPVGSMVSFPNKDPFFHNVFSLFNGKRFDLGLYEEGSTRAVKFSLTGVSYIFCNIHPAMSAVIVTLDTPYYAIPDADGNLVIHGVPTGGYRLNVWAEGATSQSLAALTRTIHVSPVNTPIEDLTIQRTLNFPVEHKNKFGENYDKNQPLAY